MLLQSEISLRGWQNHDGVLWRNLIAVDHSLNKDQSPIARDNDRLSVSNHELLQSDILWTEPLKSVITFRKLMK